MAGTARSEELAAAIRNGDLGSLKNLLRADPGAVNTGIKWGSGGNTYEGLPLNYAAACNNPAVVEFLVKEMGAEVNNTKGVPNGWTALHHAEQATAAAAAAKLLALGADPMVANDSGATTAGFCNTKAVLEHGDPLYLERKRRREEAAQKKRLEGTWTLGAAGEVIHERNLPGDRIRLTDVFNFETRSWRALAKDLEQGGLAQTVTLFDDMRDKEILHRAFDKLKELGGTADEDSIGTSRLPVKLPRPAQG